jgi:hypothetical protein
MSAAVEDAAAVVICISQAYKESANCRMEANYALQREVDIVPCMMEEGCAAGRGRASLVAEALATRGTVKERSIGHPPICAVTECGAGTARTAGSA